MKYIYPIVEGYGDVQAVPVLLRRILHEVLRRFDVEILSPFRLDRGKIEFRPNEIIRAVSLGVAKIKAKEGCGLILMIFDADSACPATMAPPCLEIMQRAIHVGGVECSLVIAMKEYEAWFLSAAQSLSGVGGLRKSLVNHPTPEIVNSPKGFLNANYFGNANSYSETADQEKFTARMDLAMARNCLSFDKLMRDLERIFPPSDE